MSTPTTPNPVPRADYFFPAVDVPWDVIAPEDVGWSRTALQAAETYSGEHGSTGLLVLCGGRILMERYWSAPDVLPLGLRGDVLVDGRVTEDVASVQKSVVSILVGIAAARA